LRLNLKMQNQKLNWKMLKIEQLEQETLYVL